MGGALPPALAYDGADNDGNRAGATAIHILPFGSEVDQLIESKKHKVVARMHDDWPLSNRCGADRNSGQRIFHRRSVEHPRLAETLEGFCRRSENARWIVDGNPRDEHGRIAFHGL